MLMESVVNSKVVRLVFIEISNFKSFGGVQHIGPLDRNFISVVGPNGAGKSNLTDAIGFVLNEKASRLRVSNMGELVFGSTFGHHVDDPTYVRARFTVRDTNCDNQLTSSHVADQDMFVDFSRHIVSTYGRLSSLYQINGEEVTGSEYKERLLSIGVNTKAKNFMVFQGQIESIAALTSNERTAVLEELSGSVTFKSEYDHLRQKLEEAICEEKKSRQLLNTVRDDYVKLRQLSNKSSELRKLQDQLERDRLELLLAKLYYNEREFTRLSTSRSSAEEELSAMVNEQQKVTDEISKTKTDYHILEKNLNEAEEMLCRMNFQLATKNGINQGNQDTCTVIQEEMESASIILLEQWKEVCISEPTYSVCSILGILLLMMRLSLNAAKRALEQSVLNLDELKAEVNIVEQQLSAELSSVDSPHAIHEETSAVAQKAEYHHLRAKVDIRAHELLLKKRILSIALSDAKFQRDEEEKKFEALVRRVDSKTSSLVKLEKNIAEIDKTICTIRQSLLKLEAVEAKYQRVVEIREELQKIVEDEKQADIEKTLRDAAEKKRSVLRELQSNFRGIRYEVAVAKIMGHKMNAIVCETAEVARAAIDYLKAHRHQPETFLPLDYLQATAVDDRVRRVLSEFNNARLVLDVVIFDPRIRKAALFCFGTTVVCETIDDARHIASRDVGEKYRAVSMDGILFEVSGVISGGLEDLILKAKQWELSNEAARQRMDRKKKLENEMSEILKQCDKQQSLVKIRMETSGLKKMIDIAEKQKNAEISLRDGIAKEIEELNSDLISVENTKYSRQQEVDNLNVQLEGLNSSISAIEDFVFRDFCKRLGIPNIRLYEGEFNELRRIESLAQRKQAVLDLEKHVERLRNQIVYDSQRISSLKSDENKHQETIQRCEKSLEQLYKQITKDNEEIRCLNDQIEVVSLSVSSLSIKITQCSEKLQNINLLQRQADTKITQSKLKISADETSLEELRQIRHSLLISAKKNNMKLPLSAGSLLNVTFETEPSEAEDQIAVDYSSLCHLQKIPDTRLKDAVLDMEKHLQGLVSDVENMLDKVDATAGAKKSAVHLELKNRERIHKKDLGKVNNCQSALRRVHTKRLSSFMQCFEVVSNNIDSIYKALVQQQDVLALLDVEQLDEPYLGGITFGCIPSGKRYRRMEDLSGGERTLAALAFILSLQSYRPAPFLVLDEIDASLDVVNIDRVANFINSCGYQFLVVSLKERLYSQSDALLAVCSKQASTDLGVIASSHFVGLLDLERYADDSGEDDVFACDKPVE